MVVIVAGSKRVVCCWWCGQGKGLCVYCAVLCCIADACSCRKVVWSWDSLQGLQRG